MIKRHVAMYKQYNLETRLPPFRAGSGLMIASQSLAVGVPALRDAGQGYRACANCCCCGCWLIPALCCAAPPRRCRCVNTFQCHPGLLVPCDWVGWLSSRVSKRQTQGDIMNRARDVAGREGWCALACSFCRSSARIAHIALQSMSTMPSKGRRGHGIGPRKVVSCS